MKIELKNIKHSEFASQETNCYEATIYIDGKKAGIVDNDGRGGCDNVYPRELAVKIDEYAKTLPKMSIGTGLNALEIEQNYETIFGDLLAEWLHAKDLKRALSRHILFVGEDDRIYQTKTQKAEELKLTLSIQKLPERLKAKAILNLLPFAKALQIYRQGGTA